MRRAEGKGNFGNTSEHYPLPPKSFKISFHPPKINNLYVIVYSCNLPRYHAKIFL